LPYFCKKSEWECPPTRFFENAFATDLLRMRYSFNFAQKSALFFENIGLLKDLETQNW